VEIHPRFQLGGCLAHVNPENAGVRPHLCGVARLGGGFELLGGDLLAFFGSLRAEEMPRQQLAIMMALRWMASVPANPTGPIPGT